MLFALLVSLFPLLSQAQPAYQWEVGGGVSHAYIHGDGVWYQKAFPNELKLKQPAFKLGVTGEFSPRLRWHLDGVYLGRYSSDALATANDANYNASSATGCNGHCLPLSRYKGSGSVFGMAATLEAHTLGAWQFGVEAGPFIYRARWRMQVIGWFPSMMGADGEFVPSGEKRDLDIDRAHWALGGVLGVSVSRGPWTLSLREYLDGRGFKIGTDPWPPIWKRHTVLMLNYRFE